MIDAPSDAPGEELRALQRLATHPAQAPAAREALPQDDSEILTAPGPAQTWRLALLGALYVIAFVALDVTLSGWLLKRAMGPEHGRGLVLWSAAAGVPACLALAALRGPVKRRTRLYAAVAFLTSGATALLRW